MQHLQLDPEAIFLCSFYIYSLFRNMPLKETIQNCADTLYDLIIASIMSVEFSFHHTMQATNRLVVLPRALHLAQLLPICLLGTTKRNGFDEPANPSCIFVTLMTPLPFSSRNLTSIVF